MSRPFKLGDRVKSRIDGREGLVSTIRTHYVAIELKPPWLWIIWTGDIVGSHWPWDHEDLSLISSASDRGEIMETETYEEIRGTRSVLLTCIGPFEPERIW